MRGIKRISASRSGRSPKSTIKEAIGKALGAEDSRFYQVSKILDYCGYKHRIAFRIEPGPWIKEINKQELVDAGCKNLDAELSISFFERHHQRELVWVDPGGSVFGYSQAREFASVLKIERNVTREIGWQNREFPGLAGSWRDRRFALKRFSASRRPWWTKRPRSFICHAG